MRTWHPMRTRPSTRIRQHSWLTASAAAVALLTAGVAGVAPPDAARARTLTGAPSCPVFPADSPWNRRIDALPTAAGSAQTIRAAGLSRLHADFSDADADGYGIPVNVVDSDTPRSRVTFDYSDESDNVPYPIPPGVRIESGSDRHALLVDRDTCRLYELYALERDGARWRAGSGATWDLRSLQLRPDGWTSADAAGLPILPGLVRHEDLAGGGIDHAIRMTLPVTQRAYLWPARHYASDERGAQHAPMGLRIRVRASFDTTRFPPQTREVLTALKRYGAIVADNGSAGYLTGAPHAGWDDDDLHALHDVPASAFEVVDTSSLMPASERARIWNLRWTASGGSHVAQLLLSRGARLQVDVRRNGAIVHRRTVTARQGYVRITAPGGAGSRASIRLLR